MIDTLLRALDLRTGRFTSPHVERMTERISVDGEPLTDEEFVARVQRRRAVHAPRRRERGAPAVVLRDDRGHGLRAVRRRARRRRRRRGRHGRLVGRHQRRRRRGRGGAAGRGRPRAVPRRHARRDRGREGRDHQAGQHRRRRRAAGRRRRGAAGPRRGGRRHRRPRGDGVRRRGPRRPPSAARCSRCRACGRGTTTCSCPSTAPTRRRTPRSRWPPSSRSSAAARCWTTSVVRAAFAEVTSPARLEIVRRSPTVAARRRAQPARRRGGGRGPGRLLRLLAAHRRDRGDGRQGRRGAARRRSSRTSRTSSAPRTAPPGRCRPRRWP